MTQQRLSDSDVQIALIEAELRGLIRRVSDEDVILTPKGVAYAAAIWGQMPTVARICLVLNVQEVFDEDADETTDRT